MIQALPHVVVPSWSDRRINCSVGGGRTYLLLSKDAGTLWSATVPFSTCLAGPKTQAAGKAYSESASLLVELIRTGVHNPAQPGDHIRYRLSSPPKR